MSKKFWVALTVAVVLMGIFVGCGGGKTADAPAGIPEDAALKITGNVAQEVGWTEEQVKALDTMDAQYENKEGEMETYTGVSVNTLLEMAKVNADASAVVFVADDGYSAEMALADVQGCQECIVSFRSQGGFRTVMPGFPGNFQVRGVIEMQVK
ncbi:MAG: hypothetical protein JW981_10915 [Anaerolineae bacterium]|nr:hypothetical protein [Anaerolineae bacterium]